MCIRDSNYLLQLGSGAARILIVYTQSASVLCTRPKFQDQDRDQDRMVQDQDRDQDRVAQDQDRDQDRAVQDQDQDRLVQDQDRDQDRTVQDQDLSLKIINAILNCSVTYSV